MWATKPSLHVEAAKLCMGLEAGIKGTLHAVCCWVSYPTESIEDKTKLHSPSDGLAPQTNNTADDDSLFPPDPQGLPATQPGKWLTFVGATNGFNKLSCMTMLWTLCHLLPKGRRFAFNWYQHDVMLVVHSPGQWTTHNNSLEL